MTSGFEPPRTDERASLLWPAVIGGAGLVLVLFILVAGAVAWRFAASSKANEAAVRDALVAENARAATHSLTSDDQSVEPATSTPGDTASTKPSGFDTDETFLAHGEVDNSTNLGSDTSSEPTQVDPPPPNSGGNTQSHGGGPGQTSAPNGGGNSNSGGDASPSGNDSGGDSSGGGGAPAGEGSDDQNDQQDDDNDGAGNDGDGNGGGGDTSVPTSLADLLKAHPELVNAGGNASSNADRRQSVPGVDVLSTKQAEIRSLFPLESARTAETKAAMATRMLAAARDTENDPAAEFVLLTMAGDIAAAAGELTLALQTVDDLDERFVVDRTMARWEMFEKVAQSRDLNSFGRQEMLNAGKPLVDQLLHEDHYVEAAKLIKMLQGAARRAQDRRTQNELALLHKRGSELYTAYKKVLPNLQTLESEPDNDEASLAAGKFYAFVKADWPRGMALFAQSSSEPLQQLAIAERDRPEDPQAQADLGNAWWNFAATSEGHAADMQRARAAMWYGLLIDETSGLDQVRVRQRIAEAQQADVDGGRPLTAKESELLGLD